MFLGRSPRMGFCSFENHMLLLSYLNSFFVLFNPQILQVLHYQLTRLKVIHVL
jgi:hypothetical protein